MPPCEQMLHLGPPCRHPAPCSPCISACALLMDQACWMAACEHAAAAAACLTCSPLLVCSSALAVYLPAPARSMGNALSTAVASQDAVAAAPARSAAAMRSLAATRLTRSIKHLPTLSDPATRKALHNLATLVLSPREWWAWQHLMCGKGQ